MKTIAQLVESIAGVFDGTASTVGSRKLEIGLAALLICALAESWLGVGIAGAGYCIGQGLSESKAKP